MQLQPLIQSQDNDPLDPVSDTEKTFHCSRKQLSSRIDGVIHLELFCFIFSLHFLFLLFECSRKLWATFGPFHSPELETSSSSRRAFERERRASCHRRASDGWPRSIHRRPTACSASASCDCWDDRSRHLTNLETWLRLFFN